MSHSTLLTAIAEADVTPPSLDSLFPAVVNYVKMSFEAPHDEKRLLLLRNSLPEKQS